MCGRFALHADAEEMAAEFGVDVPGLYQARYNIAPSTPVLAITEKGLTFFHWGLIPSWMKEPTSSRAMINARAETVTEKPSFKHAFKRRRCLIPASGFYEWQSESGKKQPYYCQLNRPVFGFAGIWERWQDAMGNELISCAILTTEARGNMAHIHHRMPVVIRPQDYPLWLDHQAEDISPGLTCIDRSENDFSLYAVSKRVNVAANDGAELIERLTDSG